MANTLEGFLAKNKIKKENMQLAVSKNFLDAEGNPLKWELKPLNSKEDVGIRKKCYLEVRGKNGQTKRELDGDLYIAKLAAESVVYPDLLNAELQDSYGVKTPHDLLMAMLEPGELAMLEGEVQKLCGFDTAMTDLVNEAKN